MFLRALRSLGVVFLFLVVAMFLPAGNITWTKGWTFLLVLFLLVAPSVLYLWRVNPEIFVARSRIHEGTKPWDKVETWCCSCEPYGRIAHCTGSLKGTRSMRLAFATG
jgi:hypothetical protein